MKFLADENIGLTVISPLRNLNFDIQAVGQIAKGADDKAVLALANKENRILITSDKDFGELIYAQKLLHAGVILLRLKNDSSRNKLRVLRNLLLNHADKLEKAFTVVREETIRIRNIELN